MPLAPHAVVVDLITTCRSAQFTGHADAVIDNTSALFTSLTRETMISSLMDAWILTTAEAVDRRRQRWLYVLKARGIAHSDEIRQFRFSDRGISLLPMAQGIGNKRQS